MNQQAKINMIFGKRGSGKTTKVRELTRTFRRVLYYDTLGRDYSDGVICETLTELKAFWRRCYQGAYRLVYRPADPEGDFPAVCELVFAAGEMAYVVEEADLFFQQGSTCPEFRNLIQRGRHAGVEMYCVTQRPKGFGRLLTSQTEKFYLFSTREPDDLRYFRDRCGDAVAARLPDLPKFQCIEYDDYTGCEANTDERRDDSDTA